MTYRFHWKGSRLLIEGKKEEKLEEDNDKWIHRGYISRGSLHLQF